MEVYRHLVLWLKFMLRIGQTDWKAIRMHFPLSSILLLSSKKTYVLFYKCIHVCPLVPFIKNEMYYDGCKDRLTTLTNDCGISLSQKCFNVLHDKPKVYRLSKTSHKFIRCFMCMLQNHRLDSLIYGKNIVNVLKL